MNDKVKALSIVQWNLRSEILGMSPVDEYFPSIRDIEGLRFEVEEFNNNRNIHLIRKTKYKRTKRKSDEEAGLRSSTNEKLNIQELRKGTKFIESITADRISGVIVKTRYDLSFLINSFIRASTLAPTVKNIFKSIKLDLDLTDLDDCSTVNLGAAFMDESEDFLNKTLLRLNIQFEKPENYESIRAHIKDLVKYINTQLSLSLGDICFDEDCLMELNFDSLDSSSDFSSPAQFLAAEN